MKRNAGAESLILFAVASETCANDYRSVNLLYVGNNPANDVHLVESILKEKSRQKLDCEADIFDGRDHQQFL